MTITFTIPGVPLLDQLKEASNPRDDCVFTTDAALATGLLKRPFTGTQIKAMDNNYGPQYTGFASQANLLDTMAKLGVSVARLAEPTQAGLVAALHREIAAGHPCVVTMPSEWGTAPANPRTYKGYMHVGLMCGYGLGMLRCMNPWHGFWQDQSDAWWAARLLQGEIWVGSLLTAVKETMMIPQGWKDDGKTLVAPNGVPVVHGMRAFVLSYPGGWEADNLPERAEQHMASVEPGNTAIGAGVRQDFRWRSLGWTESRGAYVIWVGHDIIALESQLAAALAHVTLLEQQIQTLHDNPPSTPPAPATTTPPDPKAIEALNAVLELAKALKLVQAA